MNLAEFLAMGGYAAYVWPAYAFVLAVLALNVWAARRSHERALEEARRRFVQEESGR
ncbi:MAG: heme exporter protein CcmD [Steroidobacteraceae bacterium]